MTENELLRIYDALILCAEQGKYGETKETVRRWLEWAVEAYGVSEFQKGCDASEEIVKKVD